MDVLQTALVCVHAVAASFVILFGPVNFLRRRKDAPHKLLGRTFAVMMAFVCISGMFIYTIGGFTIFHALAILNFTCTAIGVVAIRRHNVALHAGMMIGAGWEPSLRERSRSWFPGDGYRRSPYTSPRCFGRSWPRSWAAATIIVCVSRRPYHPGSAPQQPSVPTADRIDVR